MRIWRMSSGDVSRGARTQDSSMTPRTWPSRKPNATHRRSLRGPRSPQPRCRSTDARLGGSSSTPSPQTWTGSVSGWTNDLTRLTMPLRGCARGERLGRSLSRAREIVSCSCGSPSTPPSPTAAASRSASLSTTASRREVRLARARVQCRTRNLRGHV